MYKISIQTYNSPVGEILLGSYEGKLCLADWKYRRMRTTIDKRIQKGLNAKYVEEDTEVLKEACKQFNEYFDHKRQSFDIPLLMVGTDFQRSVWDGLMQIPYGTTFSYLELAKRIDNEKAVRAVASANGANAISILIPCHRIIGSNGDLVGYAGGLPAKKKLLELESNLFT
ncbi:MAG: cysteine methyltransferase [Epsilonproteobacteria bacterium]|nr:MAG: cysteine methyltransferase [Campylobacterota bacterium]